jgi:hypothetical protein
LAVPIDRWDLPIDAWDVPGDAREFPIDTWDVPGDRWDLPIDAWDVPLERWDIPAQSASSPLAATGLALFSNLLLEVQTLLLIFDVGGSYFQTSFAVFVPALPAVVAHNSVANIIRLTDIN